MATLAELEKKRAKAESDFETAQDALEKAVKAALANSDADKVIEKLRGPVTEALNKAIKAGEAYEDADEKMKKAAKAAEQ